MAGEQDLVDALERLLRSSLARMAALRDRLAAGHADQAAEAHALDEWGVSVTETLDGLLAGGVDESHAAFYRDHPEAAHGMTVHFHAQAKASPPPEGGGDG